MARSNRNKPRVKGKKKVHIKDDRDKLSRSGEKGDPKIPIRTIMYMELGGFAVEEAQEALKKASRVGQNGHPHYFIPLRYNKVENVYGSGTEIDFEGEFLDTVNRLCEVNEDGKIVLKGGAREVDVIRVKINT